MNKKDKSASAKKKSHPFWRVFWLSFLVLSLWYAWYSFYAPANDVAWADNMATAQRLAKESDKNMMLFFTGQWCVPCRIMKREVFAEEDVARAINSKFVPIMIDVDDPNVQDLVERYNAGVTPITIFTDPDGVVIDYSVGKMEKAAFLKMLSTSEP